MSAATIERRLKDPDLPDAVRDLLALRQQSSKTSTGKYRTMLRCVSGDGRLRGATSYSGAWRTLRWAGNRFQPHNLPRPKIGSLRGKALKNEIARGIEAIKAGVFDLTCTYPLPQVASSAVRGCIVPARGKKLTVGDYSNVEGRGLAWLAGEEWKLDAFGAYDGGTGPDLYKLAYAEAFGIDPDDVDDTQRQVGKVMELMLGYGGGVNAFVTGAATYGVNLDDLQRTAWPNVPQRIKDETARMWVWAVEQRRTCGLPEMTFRVCDALKRMWREKHPAIVQFWRDLEDAWRLVCQGRPVEVGEHLAFDRVGAWLRVRGPSGSYLSYPGARVKGDGSLTFLGQNPYTRAWGDVGTYGGKLAENATQWLCRNLLAEGLVECEDRGYEPVLHVHDEIAGENCTEGQLSDAMMVAPWIAGLPLAVATFTTDRYHKD